MSPHALLLALSLILPSAAAASSPRVELFAPEGFSKGVRQATARFSQPMVPLGDLRGREPFDVDCAAPGKGRWVDDRNWAYDFDKDLPAGLRCTFTLKRDLAALDGPKVRGKRDFRFTTGGPAVTSIRPWEGSRIAEDQAFVLTLDAPATPESIRAHARFSVDGLLEPLPAEPLEGAAAKALMKAAHMDHYPNVAVIAARRPFPADTTVRLIWGKGISDGGGSETQEDQTFAFKTRPPFTAELTCERADAASGCLPFAPVFLRFSSPVDARVARAARLRPASGGKAWEPRKPKRGALVSGEGEDEGEGEPSGGEGRWITELAFDGPFPAEADLTLSLPALVDDAGRALTNAAKFPLTFKTGPYPPLAKFPADFGILELKASPVLPVTLRNLEPEVRARLLKTGAAPTAGALESLKARLLKTPAEPREVLRRLDQVLSHTRRDEPALDGGTEISVPKPRGAQAFEVVGIPLKAPGFYVVELESLKLGEALLGRRAPMYVPAAALVTNLSVHLLWGRESSLVWVTALDTGKPVPGAAVTVTDCEGRALWTGSSGPDGLARAVLPPDDEKLPRCGYGVPGHTAPYRLAAFARLGDDQSFVLDTWSEGIEPWRFQLPYEYGGAPASLARAVLDRTLVRAGEPVHMKLFLRRQTSEGFSIPQGPRPAKAVVVHEGSEQRWDVPLSWAADGTAVAEWSVPKEAKLGSYAVILPEKDPERTWWDENERAAAFRVEEFRLPVMTAQLQPPAAPLVAVSSIPVHLAVRYLSGGGAAALPVKLRAQLEPRAGLSFPAFEGFTFSNGPVPPEARRPREQPVEPIRSQDLVLDAAGAATAVLDGAPGAAVPQDLALELEYRDADGETQTVSSRVPLWPSRRLVGLSVDGWTHQKGRVKLRAAVATLEGAPVAGTLVGVSLYERRYRSFRKRLVGGFYAYEHSERLVPRGPLCSGMTDAHGLLFCDAPAPVSGGVILEAAATDEAGRALRAHEDAWIAGSDDWWFDVSDSDRMDVLPEKPHYEPGQVAPLQVRMPFRQATALIAVEREGVLDAYVRTLSGKSPVVRVPVKGSYAPNVFVSVLAVRGRAGSPQATALVDLARPAFRLGIAELKVGRRAHELKVAVTPDRPAYKVRQKARVTIAATLPDGTPPPAGTEAAVAVVDQALLELMPNQSWQLLDQLLGRRSLSVRTFTAQLHVVGKRHFGLKALPQGGGGGRMTTRELFDTLLYWNPRVPLDAMGRAVVDVPLNDSVTEFRAAAVVSSGAQRYGTGTGSFRATQDLALHAGLPPLAREGDRYDALFTARNATERAMDVVARATATADSGAAVPLEPRSFRLEPGRSLEVQWPVDVPLGAKSVSWTASLEESGGERDSLKVSQRVTPSVPVRVLQATLAAVEGTLKLDVARPSDALPGRGGIRVSLSPSLAGDLEGLLLYMRAYPYGCLEQRSSKAVALRDHAMWEAAMEALPSYLDSDGLAKYFPAMDHGSDALTAYLLSLSEEAGWPLPDEPKRRMAEALKGFIEGRVVRGSNLPTNDLAYRKIAAAEALSRLGPLPEGLLKSVPPQPQLWPTSAVIDWRRIWARESNPDAAVRLAEADQILRSRLNLPGTTMGFSTDTTDCLWWLMVSGDENAVRFALAVMEDQTWKRDVPRLLRGALGRRRHGHWDLTTANAWGRLMLEKFARLYEAGPVAGVTTAALGEGRSAVDWNETPKGGALTLAWPEKTAALTVSHDGRGKPWATVQSLAAVPLKEPLSSGFKITRAVSAVTQKTPGLWSRGDVARVRLEVDAQSDMGWVVVDDPVPAGATILGGGLGRDSRMSTQGENADREGWTWPSYEERAQEAFRAYYEFVPKGSFSVEYTVRLNNPGRFALPPTRVEAMYSPEMFGELPLAEVEVRP